MKRIEDKRIYNQPSRRFLFRFSDIAGQRHYAISLKVVFSSRSNGVGIREEEQDIKNYENEVIMDLKERKYEEIRTIEIVFK